MKYSRPSSKNRNTHELDRHFRAAPMSEDQYDAFHEEQKDKWSIEARASEAAERGVELRVQSLLPPGLTVSYSEFARQVEQRKQARESYAGELALATTQETS